MTDLLSTLQLVLKDGGYQCWLMPVERRAGVTFEDDTLMGFGYVFEDPQSLIEQWRAQEAATLNRYASRFRAANEKAWNIYSIFLCATAAEEAQARVIRQIEEDLDRTRKIAACGVGTVDEVVTALLPIMPLQYRPTLEQEDYAARLRRRIADFAPDAAEAALNEDVPPADVIALLGTKS
ncbi:hypothetical protein GPL21_30695 [Bradyrhizobium pachyrhizi]|uniref:Uncharacterized protein n=1 Tax=Bradyrhizobium pachyrhizi TaxID=280333 RepID=A0A844SU17_9BRAD|nr:hypothetical protein [Bradyrhizobium pachyrhizi]MVT69466.1 hypothetical protein [Bradyrhizobium pachyrhizi]